MGDVRLRPLGLRDDRRDVHLLGLVRAVDRPRRRAGGRLVDARGHRLRGHDGAHHAGDRRDGGLRRPQEAVSAHRDHDLRRSDGGPLRHGAGRCMDRRARVHRGQRRLRVDAVARQRVPSRDLDPGEHGTDIRAGLGPRVLRRPPLPRAGAGHGQRLAAGGRGAERAVHEPPRRRLAPRVLDSGLSLPPGAAAPPPRVARHLRAHGLRPHRGHGPGPEALSPGRPPPRGASRLQRRARDRLRHGGDLRRGRVRDGDGGPPHPRHRREPDGRRERDRLRVRAGPDRREANDRRSRSCC